MSLTVYRGQKTDLTRNYPGLSQVMVSMGWEVGKDGIEIDSAAFMLQSNGKCPRDEDFIFYGNPVGRNSAVTVQDAKAPDKAQLKVNLATVPSDIEKIAFTLTIYEGPARGHNFGQVLSSYLSVTNTGNEEIIRFNMGRDFNTETAIVVAELYRHKGEWKLNPVAMGYQGGLAALCGSFGIVTSDTPKVDTAKLQIKDQPAQKINLSKIELKKKGDKINLEKKHNNKLGEILINLNWNQKKPQPTGFLGSIFGGGDGIDLDLGCFFEMRNGDKGVIQALGKSFGSYNSYPYIALDGDDRTGAVTSGENIRINGDRIPEFKRILIFSYIYKGVANWAEADGVITIKQPGGPDIVVKLDEHKTGMIMCAIGLIENVRNETFSVERLVRYFPGHQHMDREFGWGMRWKAGSKD